jgi:hypothetical protein
MVALRARFRGVDLPESTTRPRAPHPPEEGMWMLGSGRMDDATFERAG